MDLNLKKWAPWNWFKKEQDEQQAARSLPPMGDSPGNRATGQLSPLLQMHREIDRLFDEAFRSFGFGFPTLVTPRHPSEWQGTLRPALDIQETDKLYKISLEAPGVDEKDIHVTLDNDVLVIRGEKTQEEEHKEGQMHRVERLYGSFQRALNLPDDADQESIKASFKNGVLVLTIDKRQISSAQRGRAIPIES